MYKGLHKRLRKGAGLERSSLGISGGMRGIKAAINLAMSASSDAYS